MNPVLGTLSTNVVKQADLRYAKAEWEKFCLLRFFDVVDDGVTVQCNFREPVVSLPLLLECRAIFIGGIMERRGWRLIPGTTEEWV